MGPDLGRSCKAMEPGEEEGKTMPKYLLINSTGSVNVRLKPLLTVEDLDEAAKKTPSYRAPGQ